MSTAIVVFTRDLRIRDDPDEATRAACGYPMPIVDHHDAIAAYKARFSAR